MAPCGISLRTTAPVFEPMSTQVAGWIDASCSFTNPGFCALMLTWPGPSPSISKCPSPSLNVVRCGKRLTRTRARPIGSPVTEFTTVPLTMKVSPPLAGDEGGIWASAAPARSAARRHTNSWQRQARRSEPTADCAERCAAPCSFRFTISCPAFMRIRRAGPSLWSNPNPLMVTRARQRYRRLNVKQGLSAQDPGDSGRNFRSCGQCGSQCRTGLGFLRFLLSLSRGR